MKNLSLTIIAIALPLWGLGGSAAAQTSTDYMKAWQKADVNVPFDVNAQGQEYRVTWGMDAAWDWDFNVNRGIAHIGKGNFGTGRVSFQPVDLVTDNGDGTYTLTTRQQKKLKSRCALIKATGTKKVNLNCDHEALFFKVDADGNYPVDENGEKIEDFTGRTNYRGKPQEWYKLIKASVQFVQKQGLTVVSVSPFNEPDFVNWHQATSETQAMKDFLAIAQLIKDDDFFDGIRVCGGNTLNDDRAWDWYSYLRDYLDEGNTHQLAGSFDNYANFFTQVKADGRVATADELHNVGEAIVGVTYGMENGIWWGFDSKARGQFCIDSNEGVRIGYGENRSAWTNAAVYRNEKTGEVHGYFGSSERQAVKSTFAYVSTTQDVFFNGYGPTRMYVYEVPGGKKGDYQAAAQINAERLFDITWGEDVAPGEVNGTYLIMNASSQKWLTYMGTNKVQSARTASGTSQQWNVYPSYTAGDISYWFIDNVTTNENRNLNVLNNNLNDGAEVICYRANHGINEQWYLKYAQDGYYYIISRLNNKYLYCSSTTSGTTLTLKNAPSSSTLPSTLKKYLWRFQPIDSKADTDAPAAPADITAKQRSGSVELSWTAPTDDDPLTYTILRSESSLETYNTIGRNIATTTFTDNTAICGKSYQYKVVAVDYAGNRSKASTPISAAPLTEKALLCQLQFEQSLEDNSANQLDAAFYGTPNYSSAANYHKSGTYSLNLTGSTYAMLPYSVAQMDEMTIATWVRTNNSTAWQRVFDFGNSDQQYMFFTPTNGSEMRFVMKNGGDEQILTNGKPLSSGTWHHVAITLKPLTGGNVQVLLYVDGEQVASNSFSIKPSDIAPSLCFLGRSQFLADPLFSGRIDDFRIYNYALTGEEIAAMMTDLEAVSEDISDTYEETTAISAPEATKASQNTNGQAFDLNGLPAAEGTRGIVIQEGKLIYKK